MKPFFLLALLLWMSGNVISAGVVRDPFGNIVRGDGAYCRYAYLADVGVSAAGGPTVLLADANVAIEPKVCVAVTFASRKLADPREDEITFVFNPSLNGTFSASLGPHLSILDAKAFDKSIGGGINAGAEAELTLSLGTNQFFTFKPGELKLAAKDATCANDFCDFSRSHAMEHMTSAGLALSGSLKISAGIGGYLGLGNSAGVSGDIGASATMGEGLEGRVVNSPDSDDKYLVIYKSSLAGSFNAGNLALSLAGGNIPLNPYPAAQSVSFELHLILKFKQDKTFNGMSVYFANGFEFTDGPDNPFIRELKAEAGNCAESAELDQALAGKCIYSFDISKELAEKYFREIILVAKDVTSGSGSLNAGIVKEKVREMYRQVQNLMQNAEQESLPYQAWKEIRLEKKQISLGVDVNAASLGINGAFFTSKSFLAEEGICQGGELHPVKTYKYTKEVAKYKRDLNTLLDKVKNFLIQLANPFKECVCRQEADGTIMLYGLCRDGIVKLYYIETGSNPVQSMSWT
ncbi:MAG: hypothetical protein PHW04_18510 [Candidatus Wallbacteria bacterium]|nr:hypothetical protein [Candidatus Wallbacteria bacterium]